MIDKIRYFFSVLSSYLIAISRLFFLDALLFLSGLQQILYSRCEIVNVEMKVSPLRCDINKVTENVSYIEKLCCENPDLVEIVDNDEDIDFGDNDDN